MNTLVIESNTRYQIWNLDEDGVIPESIYITDLQDVVRSTKITICRMIIIPVLLYGYMAWFSMLSDETNFMTVMTNSTKLKL